MISPSLTMTVANGSPPAVTFARIKSMVCCAKSMGNPPIDRGLRPFRGSESRVYVFHSRRASSLGRVRLPRPVVGSERSKGRQNRLFASFAHLAFNGRTPAAAKELGVH